MATSESTERTSSPLNSSAEDSPASPLVSPVDESANLTNDGSGLSLHESFAFYGPGGFSSKTSLDCSPATVMNWQTRQTTLFGNQECQMYSGSWPPAGMTRNGIAYRLPRSVPRISASGRSSLPTLIVPNGGRSIPPASKLNGKTVTHHGKKIQVDLNNALRMPTLRSSDGKAGPQHQRKRGTGKGSHHGGNLAAFLPTLSASMVTIADMEQARYAGHDPQRPKYRDAGSLPTLQARDYRSGKTRTSYGNSRPLNEVLPTLRSSDGEKGGRGDLIRSMRQETPNSHFANVAPKNKSQDRDGGPLNPAWCEWYMGFPIGWTELEDSETPSSRKSRNLSAGASSKPTE